MVRLFSITWWGGFVIAIAFMVSLYLKIDILTMLGIDKKTVDISRVFLLLGIEHMLILVILGFVVIVKDKFNHIEIASRVSTMGYLHTLIGTAVALIMTSQFGANIVSHINDIVAPIGSALVTSIIGWATAEEMKLESYANKEERTKEKDVEDALDVLAKKIVGVGVSLETSVENWKEHISETIFALSQSTNELKTQTKNTSDSSKELLAKLHQEVEKSLNTMIDKIQENLQTMSLRFEKDLKVSSKGSEQIIKTIVGNFDNLHKEMKVNLQNVTKQFKKDLEDSSKSSKDLISGFISSFETIFEEMENNTKVIEKSLKNSSVNSEKVLQDLNSSFKRLFKQIESISAHWEEHLKGAKKLSDNSEILQEIYDNSIKISKEITTLDKELPKADKILRDIDSLIAQLKFKEGKVL